MLDPRYKNTIFPLCEKPTVFNLVLEELEKIQDVTSTNCGSPPTKRTKTDNTVNFMEAMLEDLDEHDKGAEVSDSNEVKDVNYLITDICNLTLFRN